MTQLLTWNIERVVWLLYHVSAQMSYYIKIESDMFVMNDKLRHTYINEV